jgi:hypothetical protein
MRVNKAVPLIGVGGTEIGPLEDPIEVLALAETTSGGCSLTDERSDLLILLLPSSDACHGKSTSEKIASLARVWTAFQPA